MSETLLKFTGLNIHFSTRRGNLHAIRDVDLLLHTNETVAVVGESGAGKSVLAKSILRQHLPPFTPNRVKIEGDITYLSNGNSINLTTCNFSTLRMARARLIATISQESLSGLNPVITIGAQITEAARAADPNLTKHVAKQRALSLIESVGIDNPQKRFRNYPHQLSGGQRQRVMIAIAAIRQPHLLIADEPTTALDVTIQARILALIKKLQRQTGMTIFFITHDLGVVSQIADRVAVMYGGRIVEVAKVSDILAMPRHPYTAGLLATIPGGGWNYPRLTGFAPDPFNIPSGCAFKPRCPRALKKCDQVPQTTHETERSIQCWNPL